MHSSEKPADIVVIGGGIVGTATAYRLARLGAGRIVLLEREVLTGTGSTGRCAGGFRHQFSTEINVKLSLLSIPMLMRFEEETGRKADVHQDGYLFLLSRPKDVAVFRRNIAMQNALGVPSTYLEPAEIGRLAPHVALDGVLGAAYCALDGIGDPDGVTQGYAAAARALGVEIRTGTAATGLRCARGTIEGVEAGSTCIPCGAVVNAAGPHAREIASWAGVDLPVFPERRHVYTTFPFDRAPADYRMVIDFGSTFYFHRESSGVLMGMGNPGESSSFDLAVDPGFLEKVLETGLTRYPALAEAAIRRAWVGLYEMSPDAHPILGRVEEMSGFYLANGFSGHGFQHAPAAGMLVAEEIVYGAARTLDIAPLRFDRFRTLSRIREHNVV